MGALIVVGDGPEVLNICSGGFLLDAAFSPQRLSELAKMDGAIILASDASRIARANVHLVPDPNVPTSETGTRHRTAERVARSIDVPVISVSEDLSIIAVYMRSEKHPLEDDPPAAQPREPGAADARAVQDQARRRVGRALGARGRRPRHAARRAVASCSAPRWCMRIADEIDGYIVELGVDGRLVRLQLDELLGGIEDDAPPRRARLLRRRRRPLDRVPHERARRARHRRAASTCRAVAAAARASRGGRGRPRRCGAAEGLPAAQQDPAPARPGDRQRRRAVRHAPQDHAGDDRRPRRRRRRGRRRGRGRSRTACRASPRAASSTVTPDAKEIETSCASSFPRGRRPSSSKPEGDASLGLVIAPDIFGLRPLYDDLCAAPVGRARLGGVRGRALPRSHAGRRRRALRRGAESRRRPGARRPHRGWQRERATRTSA